MADQALSSNGGGKLSQFVGSKLGQGAVALAGAAGKRLLSNVTDRLSDATGRLTEYAENGGGPGLLKAVTGLGGEGGPGLLKAVTGLGGGGKKGARNKGLKVTNIVETIDVGVPVHLAYDQWTRFTDFPNFMKKVESVEQEADEKLHWKAQVFWSHRTWESTITEQVPDQRIVWRSKGAKGSVDGAVTFHELAPELTKIIVVLEYHPQGFFERTGNLWRAQGRRARLELKHFARHVMTQSILHPDEIEGWRGEIHDGQVVDGGERAEQEAEPSAPRAEEPSRGEQASRAQQGEPSQRPRERAERGERGERGEARGPREGERRPERRPPGPEERRSRPASRSTEGGGPRRPAPSRESERG